MDDAITARLKKLIYGSGKTYRQLAREIGVPFSTIAGWMNLDKLPDAYNLIRVCRYFHVKSDWLLGLSQER